MCIRDRIDTDIISVSLLIWILNETKQCLIIYIVGTFGNTVLECQLVLCNDVLALFGIHASPNFQIIHINLINIKLIIILNV